MGSGARDYGRKPILPYRRGVWEFQAFLSGSATLLRPEAPPGRLQAPRLALFAPEHRHGWSGGICEVAVFHFESVPPLLAAQAGNEFVMRLARADVRLLRTRARELQELRQHPTALLPIRAEQQLLDLTLMALREWEQSPEAQVALRPASRVDQILSWYANHLHEAPDQLRVCRQFSISPAHLRRIFHAERNESPRRAFERIRMERARQMLREGEKMEAVAPACGYSEASALSRAFRAHFGTPPRRRRREPARETN